MGVVDRPDSTTMVLRRSLCLVLVVSIGAAACGSGDRPTQVAAGGDPAPGSSTTVTAFEVTSTTAAATATTSTAVAPTTATTTTATTTSAVPAADPGAGTAASPVDGLDASELKAVVEAPLRSGARSATGPVVDQVTVADGTTIWRVRVPGAFTARSARVAVSVGGRLIGEAVLAPDLQSIVAVTTDGAGLTAGRAVSYQWEGGPSVPAGTLVVAR